MCPAKIITHCAFISFVGHLGVRLLLFVSPPPFPTIIFAVVHLRRLCCNEWPMPLNTRCGHFCSHAFFVWSFFVVCVPILIFMAFPFLCDWSFHTLVLHKMNRLSRSSFVNGNFLCVRKNNQFLALIIVLLDFLIAQVKFKSCRIIIIFMKIVFELLRTNQKQQTLMTVQICALFEQLSYSKLTNSLHYDLSCDLWSTLMSVSFYSKNFFIHWYLTRSNLLNWHFCFQFNTFISVFRHNVGNSIYKYLH